MTEWFWTQQPVAKFSASIYTWHYSDTRFSTITYILCSTNIVYVLQMYIFCFLEMPCLILLISIFCLYINTGIFSRNKVIYSLTHKWKYDHLPYILLCPTSADLFLRWVGVQRCEGWTGLSKLCKYLNLFVYQSVHYK